MNSQKYSELQVPNAEKEQGSLYLGSDQLIIRGGMGFYWSTRLFISTTNIYFAIRRVELFSVKIGRNGRNFSQKSLFPNWLLLTFRYIDIQLWLRYHWYMSELKCICKLLYMCWAGRTVPGCLRVYLQNCNCLCMAHMHVTSDTRVWALW